MALTLSYLMFGNIANITWEYINTREARQHLPEAFYFPITEFSEGRKNNKIHFKFKGEHESINVAYKTIKPYLDTNPKGYELEVVARKGIWNYYVVEDWNIKKR